jgi:glycosyltransferase involved in cell wall biosynthesis
VSVLVSAIMPTRGRPALARAAVESFRAQTWGKKELLILDDGDSPSFPEPPPGADIRYWRRPERLLIGEKRNLLCAAASGEVVIHFDDDDWSAPTRIADQVERLLANPAGQVTGFTSLVFWSCKAGQAREWSGSLPCGTSLCYRLSWWKSHQFPRTQVEEDRMLAKGALLAGALVDEKKHRFQIVARAEHGGNTSTAKSILTRGWKTITAAEMPPAFMAVAVPQ